MADWECTKCTLKNPDIRPKCEACNAQRPPSPSSYSASSSHSHSHSFDTRFEDERDAKAGRSKRRNGEEAIGKGYSSDHHHRSEYGRGKGKEDWGDDHFDPQGRGVPSGGDHRRYERKQTPQGLTMNEEKKQVREKAKEFQKLVVGDTHYVIDRSWWEAWCRYVGLNPDDPTKTGKGGGEKPGDIDNSKLIIPGQSFVQLKKDLTLGKDFILVHKEIFWVLKKSYRCSLELPRTLIEVGTGSSKQERFDLYPVVLFFRRCHEVTGEPEPEDRRKPTPCSEHLNLQYYLDLLAPDAVKERQQKEKKEHVDGRVWRRVIDTKETGKSEWKDLSQGDLTHQLDVFQFKPATELLIEYKTKLVNGVYSFPRISRSKDFRKFEVGDILDIKDPDNRWQTGKVVTVEEKKVEIHYIGTSSKFDEWLPRDSDRLAGQHTFTEYDSSNSMDIDDESPEPLQKGVVGLRNLGNTCFMNSTLQCLLNTPQLTDYFLKKKHLSDLNPKNPLGWKGKIAQEYGSLVSQIWSGRFAKLPPRKFKQTIGEFQPRFSGYQQHDSSELLSFLLDGIHEDVNLIHDKPPTQKVESKGRDDETVADEAWAVHKLRNKSVIVDLMQGLIKSRLVCPSCKRDSTTFDPFSYLSVPLPHANEMQINITIFIRNDKGILEPQPTQLTVPKRATILELKNCVILWAGERLKDQKPSDLVVAEVWQNKIYKVYQDWQAASFQSKDDVWVFHLQGLPESKEALLEREKKEKEEQEKSKIKLKLQDVKEIAGSPVKEEPQKPQGLPDIVIFQVTHNLKREEEEDKTLSLFGTPALIKLPKSSLTSIDNKELRKLLLKAAVLPFVKQDTLVDGDIEMVLLDDREGLPFYSIPSTKSSNLLALSHGRPFMFAILWTEKSKEKYVLEDRESREPLPSFKRLDSGGPVNLSDCLSLFSQEETLRETDAWWCSHCKTRVCASKKLSIWSLPQYLIIHLKRFDFTAQFREKLDTYVEFPFELDMGQWCINPEEKDTMYDLYAVSNHMGGMGGGHYTAYAKSDVDKQWYHFNDESVTQMEDPSRCVTANAYVLFYQKRKS